MGFPQVVLALNQLPTDVTLKLSDGSIDAHKMILAAVSPVFERMFYGDFKEGKSKEVDLPKDNYKVMKLLVDFVYSGSCKVDDLDDTFPLIEAMDRYQINKDLLQHTCGEAILSQLDSSNYLTLLPKYVSVMSEESHKKAADKVMSYTNNDFVTKFDETKDLPEEVLLYLLNNDEVKVCEIEIFEFLVKWYDYQTKELDKSIQLKKQLFHSIRYFLIPPLLFAKKVASTNHLDNKVLVKAFDDMYHKPIAHNNNDEKPRVTQTFSTGTQGLSLTYISEKECSISYGWEKNTHTYKSIASKSLTNGLYAFKVTYATDNSLFRITDRTQRLCNDTKIYSGCGISLNVYDDIIFLKVLENDTVKLTVSATGERPFTLSFVMVDPYMEGSISVRLQSVF